VSVPVRGTIRASEGFTERVASEIGERLIALEKDARGAGDIYTSPAAPPFGGGAAGAPGTPGAPGAPGTPGATDHGALTGLLDDDHPQYAQREEQMDVIPHVHGAGELYGLEGRFAERIEALSTPPHVHATRDIVDFDPAQIMLFVEVFGG